jgi:hypothetical protein
MLTTEARLNANQANAEHSTGPRTPEGKAAVAQNSATFGLFCSRDLVRPEEESEYFELRDSLESDLRPATAMERTHAMEILHAAWRLRRCALVEANLLAPTLESGLDPMEDDKTAAMTQAKVDRARAHARNNLRLASQDLSRLQTERQLRAELNPDAEPEPAGLVSRAAISKTLAGEVRRQLNLRKLAGSDSLESIVRRAMSGNTGPSREIFPSITKQTHSESGSGGPS